MTCELFDQHLSAYVDFEVPPDLRLRIEEHLETCRHCREVVRDLQLTRGVLAQWQPAQPGKDFVEKVMSRLEEESAPSSRPHTIVREIHRPAAHSNTVLVDGPSSRRFFSPWMVAAAAALLLAVGVGVMMLTRAGEPAGGPAVMTAATVREMVKSVEVAELAQVTVAMDVMVAREMGLERPRPRRVIGTETVQYLLDSARTSEDARRIGILLGAADMNGPTYDLLGLMRKTLGPWTDWQQAYAQEPVTGLTLMQAMDLERKGKYPEALSAYGNIHGSTHERVVGLVRKAGLLLRLGRAEEAQAAMNEAGLLGRMMQFQEKYGRGMRERVKAAVQIAQETENMERTLAADPTNRAAMQRLLDARLSAGNFAGAADVLTRLIEQAGPEERSMLRFRLAWCWKNSGRPQQAFAELESVLSEKGIAKDTRVLSLFERADILERAGRYQEAIDEETVLIGYPGYLDDGSRALLVLRIAHAQWLGLGDRDQARKTLARLEEPRYADTPAAQVARLMLEQELN